MFMQPCRVFLSHTNLYASVEGCKSSNQPIKYVNQVSETATGSTIVYWPILFLLKCELQAERKRKQLTFISIKYKIYFTVQMYNKPFTSTWIPECLDICR